VSDDQLQPLFAALGHPVRRDVVRLLREKGPQTYSQILAELRLETGTFNYHLERLGDLLDRLEDGRYQLNDRGLAAYELITQAKTGVRESARAVSKLGLGWLAGRSLDGLVNLIARPTRVFADIQRERLPYLINFAAILLLVLVTGSLSDIQYSFTYLLGFIGQVAFVSILVRAFYRKKPSLLILAVSIGLSYMPYLVSNFLNLLLGLGLIPLNPGTMLQPVVLIASFAWSFLLSLLAVSAVCQITKSEALVVLLVTSSVYAVFSNAEALVDLLLSLAQSL
jgi:DNA-binding transcriptional ArsR family regulator